MTLVLEEADFCLSNNNRGAQERNFVYINANPAYTTRTHTTAPDDWTKPASLRVVYMVGAAPELGPKLSTF